MHYGYHCICNFIIWRGCVQTFYLQIPAFFSKVKYLSYKSDNIFYTLFTIISATHLLFHFDIKWYFPFFIVIPPVLANIIFLVYFDLLSYIVWQIDAELIWCVSILKHTLLAVMSFTSSKFSGTMWAFFLTDSSIFVFPFLRCNTCFPACHEQEKSLLTVSDRCNGKKTVRKKEYTSYHVLMLKYSGW